MVIVHSKKRCIIAFAVRNILPGMNQVSDVELSALMKVETFTTLLTQEQFIIGQKFDTANSEVIDKTSVKEKATELAKEILSLEVSAAKEVISKISDIYILKVLRAADGRKGIVEAIDLRIVAVNSQEGADTKKVETISKDTGSDFGAKLTATPENLEGTKTFTTIPALKGKK